MPRLLTGRLLYPTVSQHASAKRVSRQVWFLQDKARLFRPLPFDENDGAAFVPHRLAKRYTFDFDGAFTVHEGAFPSSIPTMIVAGNTNSRAQAPSSWTA